MKTEEDPRRKIASLVVVIACLGCLPQGVESPDASTSSSSSSSSSGAPQDPVEIRILALNDFHGNLEPPSGASGMIQLPTGQRVEAGGAAHLAALVDSLRAQNPNTIVVSAGDLLGGSPMISGLFRDEPTIEVMNLMGLELSAVGNHEFDDGQEELLRLQNGGCHPVEGCREGTTSWGGAHFQFLAANVITQDGTGPTFFPGYEVRNFDGVEVAFIGMTLEGTPDIVIPRQIEGLAFANEVTTANRLVDEIRTRGIEAIVVLLHQGGVQGGTLNDCVGLTGPIVEIAENLSEAVDVVVSGHTHRAYNCIIAGKVVTSAESYGRLLTQIDLIVDPATGDVTSKTAQNMIVVRDIQDDAVADLVASYRTLADGQANRVVGSITSDLYRSPTAASNGLSPLGAIIADAQLAAAQEPAYGSAQLAFMNPGGVRADVLHAASVDETGDGWVRYAELFEVQPFGNVLTTMTMTGEQIHQTLEQQFRSDGAGNVTAKILQISGTFSYTMLPGQAAGSRVPMERMLLNGEPMEPATSYRVAVNNFIGSGGDGFTAFVDGVDVLEVMVDIEALVQYFETRSPVAAPDLNRIHAE